MSNILMIDPTKPYLNTIVINADALAIIIPDVEQKMQTWAQCALVKGLPGTSYEVNFQCVSTNMIKTLNTQFRNQPKPTNVLSFPNNDPFKPEDTFVGDIAICVDILKQEAKDQNKTLADHLAHLIMHSILHCQGFDHMSEVDASIMETLEISLLDQFDIANPYTDCA